MHHSKLVEKQLLKMQFTFAQREYIASLHACWVNKCKVFLFEVKPNRLRINAQNKFSFDEALVQQTEWIGGICMKIGKGE